MTDHRLLTIAKRLFREREKVPVLRFIDTIRTALGCSTADAVAHLQTMRRDGYVIIDGTGTASVVQPGHNIDSMALRVQGIEVPTVIDHRILGYAKRTFRVMLSMRRQVFIEGIADVMGCGMGQALNLLHELNQHGFVSLRGYGSGQLIYPGPHLDTDMLLAIGIEVPRGV